MLNACCLHQAQAQARRSRAPGQARDLLLASMSRGKELIWPCARRFICVVTSFNSLLSKAGVHIPFSQVGKQMRKLA